jgi:hypothetical protein
MAKQNKPKKKKKKSHTNSPKDIEKQITITVEEQASIYFMECTLKKIYIFARDPSIRRVPCSSSLHSIGFQPFY